MRGRVAIADSIVAHDGTNGCLGGVGNCISGLCGCAFIKFVLVDCLVDVQVVQLSSSPVLFINRGISRSSSLLSSEYQDYSSVELCPGFGFSLSLASLLTPSGLYCSYAELRWNRASLRKLYLTVFVLYL